MSNLTTSKIFEDNTIMELGLEKKDKLLNHYQEDSCPEFFISLRELALYLNNPYLELTTNKLIEYLQWKRFLKEDSPLPTKETIEKGLAFVETITTEIWDEIHIKKKTKLTFKGVTWIVNNISDQGYMVNTSAKEVWYFLTQTN